MEEIKIRIVVADDNQNFCNELTRFLGRQKDMLVVGQAYNGLDALKLIRSVHCDLAVLDLLMPNLDGLAVLEQLTYDGVSVGGIIITDFWKEKIVGILPRLCKYVLLKPFDLNSLADRIREAAYPLL